MRTTLAKVIGAALLLSSANQMAAASEYHMHRHRATLADQDRFRNSNAYDGAGGLYASPQFFVARPYGRFEAQDEAAMTSGIAGH